MIGIKNFEMPECCSVCALNYDFVSCIITSTHMDYETMDDKRSNDCPLIEVKEDEEKRTI